MTEGVAALQDLDIARWRLRSQRLVSPYADSAREAVGSLLAVQAENPSQAAWAVASRTSDPDQADLAALLDERVPVARRPGRTEALAELALRYFTGHGPATERDLAYWATLTLTDVRAGLQQVRDQLGSFQHDGRTFWHAPGDAPGGPQEPAAHLLQILDETYRGYQDSRWVLDAAGHVPRTREAAVGMALVDAQLLAAMRRTIAHDHVQFHLRPYQALTPLDIEALDQAASRYGEYLRLAAWITLP